MPKRWVDRSYIDKCGVEELREELVLALEKQFSLVAALRDLPEVPDIPALFLLGSAGKWPEDKEKGSELQRRLGSEVIPYKTEMELGAGLWWRIREGLKLLEQTTRAPPPLAKGTVYEFENHGALEYVGIDYYHGDKTHEFRDGRGRPIYMRSERVTELLRSKANG